MLRVSMTQCECGLLGCFTGYNKGVVVVVLRRAPRALESGPSQRKHRVWVKVRCRKTSRFGHICNYCSSSLHSGYVGSAAGYSKWVYTLRSDICPNRRRAWRTASALLKVAMQSAFQAKFLYTIAVRGFV